MTWDDTLVNGLTFIEEHVLQAPLFFMSLMRHITPTLDDLFMTSLRWVDHTNTLKHQHDPSQGTQPPRALYYPPLRLYRPTDGRTHSSSAAESATLLLLRYARRAAISLAVYFASYLPYAGRLVLPAASFFTFRNAVGLGPASMVFGTVGVFLPRRYLVVFLQSYFASRGLVRELLEPYFARIRFSKEEKRKWFRSREGLLFGFGVGFYLLLRVPLLGVLIYGIAEAVGFSFFFSLFCPAWCEKTTDEFTRALRILSPRSRTRRRRPPRARGSRPPRPSGGTSSGFSACRWATWMRVLIRRLRMPRLILIRSSERAR